MFVLGVGWCILGSGSDDAVWPSVCFWEGEGMEKLYKERRGAGEGPG